MMKKLNVSDVLRVYKQHRKYVRLYFHGLKERRKVLHQGSNWVAIPIWLPLEVLMDIEWKIINLKVGTSHKNRKRNKMVNEYRGQIIEKRCDYDTLISYFLESVMV